MLASPPARESKAIHLPSGDQRGVPVTCTSNDDSWTGSEPSASETQTSLKPVLLDWNATFEPSGEMLGAICWRDEIKSLPALGGEATKSSRQIFVLVRPCTYARRWADGLTARSKAS